jgi:hypothetical protein
MHIHINVYVFHGRNGPATKGVLTMSTISHTQAFSQQADFAPEAKLKIGSDIWTPDTAGSRFYAQVLSQKPSTIAKVLALASELKESAFTPKQSMGHLKWLYTAGELEVDGKSYTPKTKEPKAAKAPKAKPEPKAKKSEVKAAATNQRRMVRTKKLKRAA